MRANLPNVCTSVPLTGVNAKIKIEVQKKRKEKGGEGSKNGESREERFKVHFIFLGDRLIGQENCCFEPCKITANQPFVDPQLKIMAIS